MKLITDAWVLACKDLRVYVRDRTALVLGFLVPIALVTVFGWIMTYAFGGSSGMPKVTLWIADEDQSERSQKMIDSLRSSEMIKLLPRNGEKAIDAVALRTKIADGDAHHGIIIPKGFGSQTPNSPPVDLKMLRDPGREMEDRMIQIALLQSMFTGDDSLAWSNSLRRLFKKQGMSESNLAALDTAMSGMQRSISDFISQSNSDADATNSVDSNPAKPATDTNPSKRTESRSESDTSQKTTASQRPVDPMKFMGEMLALENEDITPPKRPKQVTYQQAQSISGMTVMMLMFGLTGAGALLLAEKEMGTLRRLFTLPVARESVLLGKYMFISTIGVAQMVVLFVYGEFMFHVGMFRDPLTLILLIVTWVAAAGSFGMFIATFSRSAKQADSLATILILVMAALGGCWFPLQMMDLPLPMEILTKSMMTYWAMTGFQSMLWNNLSFADSRIWTAVAIQWVWAIGLAGLAVHFFRKNFCRG